MRNILKQLDLCIIPLFLTYTEQTHTVSLDICLVVLNDNGIHLS